MDDAVRRFANPPAASVVGVPHTGVRVRRAEPGDVFSLAALTMQCDHEGGAVLEPGFLTTYADAWLADPDQVAFVALAGDGRPLGMVTAHLVTTLPRSRRPVSRWMDVSLLFVTPDARGHGLGTALMQTLLAWARAHAVVRVQVSTPGSRRLFTRVGFRSPGQDLLSHEITPDRRSTTGG